MRKVAYAVSLLLFAYLAYTFYQYGRAVPQMAEVTGRAGLVSTNVTIDRLDPESGKLLYSLKAQRAVHGLQEIALEELEMAFFDSQLQEVRALQGIYRQGEELVLLPRDFTATTVDGFVLRGKDAIYTVQEQRLVSENPFVLTGQEGFELSGDRIEVWREPARMRADGNIRGKWSFDP
ncbi:LPS export ABC transporter periplasmic protein LptC [Desulfurispirillum indicum]|uniref:LPS export ABC transporter periplasmic protein LptC n=1 Tax=Desulfurispirillum indicum (strain ATCC BAA-1389 / DSM 22839 / S5) TaxID=653733 RepID=E6W105_DESIS|nr:LPS export ABC transporter periplasmic protein LptC [Desulfurispirillum indicum]ADU65337.1 protein of unknown function DUF1239 [Desulfurispirillum indicum S5]UCZ57233.1 LPS export ABC transporter periplasmic protein LptC [Desulfurispirillum indicum]